MGLMDRFRGNSSSNSGGNNTSAPQPAAPNQGGQPGAQSAAPNAAPNNQQQQNNQQQNDGQNTVGTNEPKNPMDAYAKLFDTTNQQADAPAPAFNIDPKILTEVSGKLRFTDGIDKELITKATSGDYSAMLEVMNTVGQRAYQTAISHGTSLTDKYLSARKEHDFKGIGSTVKKELVNSALNNTPNYNHPVVKAQLNMVAEAMRRENPDASPQEIAEAAQQYIQDLADAIKPEDPVKKAKAKEAEGVDWTSFLTTGDPAQH